MTEKETKECQGCGRVIDAYAGVCPYCAADPSTGERDGSKLAADEVIPRRPRTTPWSTLTTTIRSRSGLFFAISLVVGIVLLILLSNWVDRRQMRTAADIPPVPLTEVSDLGTEPDESDQPLEMPDLEFEHDGDPSRFENFVAEPGEEAPPEMENEK